MLVLLKGKKKPLPQSGDWPAVTLLIAAHNEAAWMEQKLRNSLALEYPPEKLSFIVVTDGSTDRTPELVARYPQFGLLHQPERQGKAAAINRGMQQVSAPLVVFSDANTLLNPPALQQMIRHFENSSVGAVAGEKRVQGNLHKNAAATESRYWRYESWLKTLESEFYSVMGAAGELFAMRTHLFQPLPEDTLLDDLTSSLRIAMKGYHIRYEPNAVAVELPSAGTASELKRKLRMAAGGAQTLVRFKALLLFRDPLLSFEYISHRVLRWAVAPYLLLLVFFLALFAVVSGGASVFVQVLLLLQLCWYGLACAGFLLDRQKRAAGLLFIPYYFCVMNYAMIGGMFRYVLGKQNVLWERPDRTSSAESTV